jgi:very-short-patch-repair endonuclease
MDELNEINNLNLDSNAGIFSNAKALRRTMTEAESVLWKALRNKRLNGYKFRRQHPIHEFIADFYCHEAGLIIEVDGEIHNETERKEYDDQRTQILKEYNIKVIRFTNNEILNNLDRILHIIITEIQQSILLHKILR